MAEDFPGSKWVAGGYQKCADFVLEGMRKAVETGLRTQDLTRALIDLAAISAHQVAGDEGLEDAIGRLQAFRESFRASPKTLPGFTD